jgi:hypothetical protein
MIYPKGAQAQPFFVLTSAVALEGFYGLVGELDRAAANTMMSCMSAVASS